MDPSQRESLEAQRESLRRQIRPPEGEGPRALLRLSWDPDHPDPVDPELDAALRKVFQQRPEGQAEWLRMEIDLLRRLTLAREAEDVFRAFGVLYILVPVRVQGQLVSGLWSGPIKIDPWTPREKETLARLCGLRLPQLSPKLEQATVYSQSQAMRIKALLVRQAALLEAALSQPVEPGAAAIPPEQPMAGLQEPGLTDHLDVLYSLIQTHCQDLSPETVPSARRVCLAAAQRGRRLLAQIRDLRGEAEGSPQNLSLHAILEQTVALLGQQFPHLRFHPKFAATHDRVQARPQALRHLLYTLMAGVADGLGPKPGFVGVGTRDGAGEHAGMLHIEIRDGGGLATFAGVDPVLDESLRLEHNDEASAFADWVHLAQRVDADIRILQDEEVVTRVEILLPRGEGPIRDEGDAGRLQIWLVQDNLEAARAVTQMLPPKDYAVTSLRGGQELREHFAVAPVPPDAVILEYNLPDVRGSVLRTWLYEQDPDLPVILISGFESTHPGIATASNLPSTQYLQKPFDADALLDQLRMVIRETLPGMD